MYVNLFIQTGQKYQNFDKKQYIRLFLNDAQLQENLGKFPQAFASRFMLFKPIPNALNLALPILPMVARFYNI